MNVLFKEKEESGRWYLSVIPTNDAQADDFYAFLTSNIGIGAAFNGFSNADLEKILAYMKAQDIGALDDGASLKLVVMFFQAGVRIV